MRILVWTVLASTALALALLASIEGYASPLPNPLHAALQAREMGGGHTPPTPNKHVRARSNHRPPGPVHLTLSVGYNDQYRNAAWTPVRVTLTNRIGSTLAGVVELPQSNNYQGGPPQPFHGLYQMPVVLPAGATKQVTLYVPAGNSQGEIDAQFRVGGRTVASASDYASTFADSDFVLGGAALDPQNSVWLKRLTISSVAIDRVRLTPATVDAVPEALATFDTVILADGVTARLHQDQLTALERYVHDGGSLVIVGGPNWQESLRPLPADLLPGHLVGARTVRTLGGLDQIQAPSARRPESSSVVTVLTRPRGTVLASQDGVPLAIQAPLGSGQVLYLAFDPGLDPVAHWPDAGALLSRLVAMAAPAAVSRASLPAGFQPPTQFFNQFGPIDIGNELANVPAAALPSIILFVVLTVLYILLLGPANALLLRRFDRRGLTWITVPVAGLLCVGSTFAVAFHLKGNTVLVNAVSMVQLDGGSQARQLSMYLGLFAPVRGDYRLTYDAPALPMTVPQFDYNYGGGPPPQTSPLGLRMQEGSQTQIQFLSMNMWSMRDVALHSTVNIPGALRARLHVDPGGSIVGTVENDTPLTLVRPAVIAGRRWVRLRDMSPHSTVSVSVRPGTNIYDQDHSPIWFKMYGQPTYPGSWTVSPCFGCLNRGPVFMGGGGFGGPGLPPEKSMTDRLRNTVQRIPDAQLISKMGEVLFIAWNEQHLGSISVDGTQPQRRDLNLIVSPLSVHFDPGAFQLRTGTFGARLTEAAPASVQNNCCGPTIQPVYLGSGGWAVFRFDLPRTSHLHFRQLALGVNAGGADGSAIARVYDWQARRWVHVGLGSGYAGLADPDRFVSPTGSMLIKLEATDTSGDIKISDPHQDLQISGSGVA